MTNLGETDPISSVLSNRYKVISVLGDGGFGKTFLAEDLQIPSSRCCVIKQLKPVNDNPQIYRIVQDRFQREAAILERLGDHHPQIPRLYAYFSEGDQFYLVEEWIQGETLTQKVEREGPQTEARVRSLLVDLLPAIAYIHQEQIVHRDIKPDNIILRQSDRKPVLIDFGAVKESMTTIINSKGDPAYSIVIGTPGYMPLEQMSGRPLYSSDLYSLGLTAIYLLTGKRPQEFQTDPHAGNILWQAHAPQVSPKFAALLNQTIQMHSQHRFASAQAMLTALQAMDTDPSIATIAMTHPPNSSQASPTPIAAATPPHPIPQPAASITPPISPPFPFPPPSPTYPPTVAVMPAAAPVSQSSPGGEWKLAVIIGGIIGACILVGALVLRGQVPSPSDSTSPPTSPSSPVASSPTRKTVSIPTLSPSATPSLTPSPASPVAAPPTPVDLSQANASVLGDLSTGDKNIRSGPGTNFPMIQSVVIGDRVQVLDRSQDSGGFLWYKVYLPRTQVEGWIAGQFVQVDGEAAPPADPSNPPQDTPSQPSPSPTRPADSTNATLIGEPGSKNIRSGPGTSFEVRHIAYPGDRVQILESRQDAGGYLWYRVFFPNSGAEGWIAAQLVKPD
jgi:serine/threonine-protein kinase